MQIIKSREQIPITVGVKISKEKNEQIEKLALEQNVSKSDVVRYAINLMLENK